MTEITDDQAILLERTLQTNKEVIAENRKLQDELNSRDEENNQVLHDVLKELQELKENRNGQYKMQTADCRPGTKCRLGAKCRLQTAD